MDNDRTPGKPGLASTLWRATTLTTRAGIPAVLYGIGAQVLGGLLLAPLLFRLLSALLKRTGSGAVLNYDLTSFVLSIPGLVVLFLWALVTAMLTVVALAGPVILTYDAGRGRRSGLGRALKGMLLSLLRVPGLGVIPLAILAVLLVPVVGSMASAIASLFLTPLGYSTDPFELLLSPEVKRWLIGLSITFALLGLVLFTRWSLTLHGVSIEKLRLGRALGRSARLVRPVFVRTMLIVLVRACLGALAFGLLALLGGVIARFVLTQIVTLESSAFDVVLALLLAFSSLAFAILWALDITHWAAVLTALHANLTALAGETEPAAVTTPMEVTQEKLRGARRHAWGWVLGVLALVAAATWLTMPQVEQELNALETKVTAHRGSSGEAPQNTLAAIRLAIDDKADYAEIDVLEAKDGVLVMLHDENLLKLAGKDVNVWDLTGEELTRLDVGRSFDESFSGERIPTFDQLLELSKDRIRLNVELKVYDLQKNEDRVDAFADSVVAALRRHQFIGQCIITSLDYSALQRVRTVAPEIPVGMIVSAKLGDLGDLDVDLYSVLPLFATVPFIRTAHQQGREVHVWTINDRERMEMFIERGVDNLITDYPRLARQVLEERTPTDDVVAAVRRLFKD